MDDVEARAVLVARLAAVAAGDRAALRDVYLGTSAKLLGVCLRILKQRDEAEDVLQEVYITVWERAGRFDEGLQVLSRYEDVSMHDGLAAELVAQVWLQLASLYRWLYEIPRSITFAGHSLRVAETDEARGCAHRLLGYVYWMMDEYAIARDHLARALEYHKLDGNPHELAHIAQFAHEADEDSILYSRPFPRKRLTQKDGTLLRRIFWRWAKDQITNV